MTFRFYSPAFKNGAHIPIQYTKFGDNISPPLCWDNLPRKTGSLVLIVDDPDAKPIVGRTYVHWTVTNLPSNSRGLKENVPVGITQITQIKNDNCRPGYDGPNPPDTSKHGYRFTLYAMKKTQIDLFVPLSCRQFENHMKKSGIEILGKEQFIGYFRNPVL